jgi:hypothetical protein
MFTVADRSILSQRQRSRKACQPCRQRRRKCDRRFPCQTCIRYDYDCFYSASGRSSSTVRLFSKLGHSCGVRQHQGTPSPSWGASSEIMASGQPGMLGPFKSRFVNNSSTVRFPQPPELDFISSNEPKLHGFAHNLGRKQQY